MNNLDRFMKTCSTILGLISKFQLFTKKCKFLFFFIFAETALTISRMGFFGLLTDLWGVGGGRGGGWGQKGDLSKICHTYPTLMKLGSYNLPKEGPKNT